MSEAHYFPLKKFLVVNRGEDTPDTVTVLCSAEREISVKHANSFEARRELQYQARQLGANSLLNVHLDWYSAGGATRYIAYGTPAVCGRKHINGTMTADEICTGFNMPVPVPLPPQPPQTQIAPRDDFWDLILKIGKYVGVVFLFLWIMNHIGY